MIRTATPPSKVLHYWTALNKTRLLNANSIRVFDGALYSLIDDDVFYEGYGCRKLINCLLWQWDFTRNLALKHEQEKESTITRPPEEQVIVDKGMQRVGRHIDELVGRLSDVIVGED